MIETERLILREMRASDAADLLEYQSNPDIVRYIPWPVGTEETVSLHIDKMLANSKPLPQEEGEYLVLVWELKTTGKVIGQSNISMQSKDHLRGEVGWVTHQDFQRQGFAYEASMAMLKSFRSDASFDPEAFVRACSRLVKPGGLMICSTLNRNPKSFLMAIVGAEHVMRWLPKGTHDWAKFITPEELTALLEDAGLEVTDSSGLAFDPARGFTLSANTAINYLLTARHKG